MPDTFFTFLPVEKNNGARMDDYWLWCPSVVRADDGRWHLFASRWPKALPFHPGWLTNSEVIRSVSDRPEGPYEFAEVVLPPRGPEYWDGCAAHNPMVRAFGGKFYLFYTGISYPFPQPKPGEPLPNDDPRATVGRASKRIGLAVASRPEGPWQRPEKPLLDVKPATYYSFLTSNAAPLFHEDGAVTLMFKSRRYDGWTHSAMYLGLARAADPLGPYRISDQPLFEAELEDPFLWQEQGRFFMIAKDMRARLAPEEGALVVLPSEDGLHFDESQAMLACPRALPLSDGGVVRCGHMERPSLILQGGRATHLCVAVTNGRYGFDAATDAWDAVVPLAPRAG